MPLSRALSQPALGALFLIATLLLASPPHALAQDADGDGWSVADGDCCDVPTGACSSPELVNPGAYEVPGNGVDDNCDGTIDNPTSTSCSVSTGFSASAAALASALDLCQTTTLNPPLPQRIWGLISAELLRATGTNVPNPFQASVMMTFGPNGPNGPAGNATMAVISTGRARSTSQPGFVPPEPGTNWADPVPAPAVFVSANPGLYHSDPCTGSSTIVYDSVRLRLVLRVPTNANGFQFSHRYFSSQYPDVCQQYNDHLICLLTSTHPGLPADRNVLYGSNSQPVTDQTADFTSCTPNPDYPCPAGTSELATTGYESIGAATSWATSTAPVVAGETITLEFILWDTSDPFYDALALLDNFQWSIIPRSVTGVDEGQAVPTNMLLGARPNPFALTASIDFGLPAQNRVVLEVFDVSGRRIRQLADGEYPAGQHTIPWDGRNGAGSRVGAGTYFVRLQAGDRQVVKRLVLEN